MRKSKYSPELIAKGRKMYEEEEEEEVIKFRLDGEKYMRSTKTDVVYDVEGEAVGV